MKTIQLLNVTDTSRISTNPLKLCDEGWFCAIAGEDGEVDVETVRGPFKSEVAASRYAKRFTDAKGEPVKVGDRVRGYGVNESLRGVVTALSEKRGTKPFVVRDAEGRTVYMNREWTVLDRESAASDVPDRCDACGEKADELNQRDDVPLQGSRAGRCAWLCDSCNGGE